MKNTKVISAKTKKLIFQEANSRCAFCSESNIDTLEIHHIHERADGGGNEPENLILVCANCHNAITNNTISKSEVMGKKNTLMQKTLVEKTKEKTSAKIFHLNNSINNGFIGETINIKTVRITSLKLSPPENSIASDLNKRNYVKRLIERYQEFKKSEKDIGNYKYAIIYSAIKREFKCKWDMIPLYKFDNLVLYLQNRIDKTILGRTRKNRGEKNYRSFEEFLKQVE